MSTATAATVLLPADHPAFAEPARKCHTVGTAYAIMRLTDHDDPTHGLTHMMLHRVLDQGDEARIVELVVSEMDDPARYADLGVPVRVSRVRGMHTPRETFYIAS